MINRTPLFEQHCHAGATLVNFTGWEMPLHYGSQIQEHHAVRQHAGIFDVSHMGIVEITGTQATQYLRYLLANDVAKLEQAGQALYTCMLNTQGSVIDDLIVYKLAENSYRLVVNASRREQDFNWLQQQVAKFEVEVSACPELAILAVQGPEAFDVLSKVLPEQVLTTIQQAKSFTFIQHADMLLARTGYTGEDGVEMMIPSDQVADYWQQFIAAGATPCGLGARDTLRLEAGLNLYGQDMDEHTSPLESNLAWTISWRDEQRNFIGKEALQQQKNAGPQNKLVGLVMTEPGVLRNHQKVFIEGDGEGEITSGSFSPTLGHAIALARVPLVAESEAVVVRRGKRIAVQIVKPPFVRHGQKVYR